jgi:diacylglycerol kinase (ATP)
VKARVIVNPVAGRGAALTKLPLVNERLRRRWATVDIAVTLGKGDAESLAREAAERGYTQIVTMGGDGTLNEALNGVKQSGRLADITFAVVPFGTGNDFARALGIDDVDRALEAISAGEAQAVDVGSLNGRLFINASAGGFVAEVSDAVSNELKSLAGRFAYLIAGTGVLMDYEPVGAQLTIDGGVAEALSQLHMFVISNAQTIGGGHVVAPRAQIADGLLDVCVVHSTTTADFVALLRRISVGEHLTDEHVIYRQARSVAIAFDRPIKLNTDGEVFETRHGSYEAQARSVRFLQITASGRA